MFEKEYDKKLAIKTTGIREWADHGVEYNRYEATPYVALDKLFNQYRLKSTDKVVDFGSGRGRVAFYIHNRFHVPVTGIEVNDKTYTEALNNKSSYRLKAKHIKAPINFKFGLAEDYIIKPADNRFYFFNPFSPQIFKKVVFNILESLETENRQADIILYYPLPKYKKVLKNKPSFKIVNKIKIPSASDKNEKFIIYRFAGITNDFKTKKNI